MIDELITIDTTGDGYDDTTIWTDAEGQHVAVDNNADGQYDTYANYSDFDEWGNPRHYDILADTDQNGVIDKVVVGDMDEWGRETSHSEMNDYSQNGQADMVKNFTDTNGDGEFDTVTTYHADNTDNGVIFTLETQIDLDGDQRSDSTMLVEAADTTGNGEPDMVYITMSDGEGRTETAEMSYEDFLAMNEMCYTSTVCGESQVAGQFDTTTDPSLVTGVPADDMQLWEYQGNTGRCAIYAQKFAIEALIGREVPIEELVAVAEENGWFNEASGGGTTTLNMDKLLEYYDVAHEMSFDNDMSDIEQALNQGHKVIVGVDSGQIWYGDDNNIFSPDTQADHAVEVIGIDYSNPNTPMVVLNDSGSPQGCGELVPLDVFENAWKAGDAQMIECWA